MNERIFRHSAEVWSDYPQLVAIAISAELSPNTSVNPAAISELIETAKERLAETQEGEFPEIQAWRRVFSSMGFKPTQYRSAAEALLRRLRIDGSLPSIIPIIDLCNAVSVACAAPIAVFDADSFSGNLEVCRATGTEVFATFSGENEHPVPGEIIFRDSAGNAHARRWAHRQSGSSAARDDSRRILIVSEAMHEGALETQIALGKTLRNLLQPMTTSIVGPVIVSEAGFVFA